MPIAGAPPVAPGPRRRAAASGRLLAGLGLGLILQLTAPPSPSATPAGAPCEPRDLPLETPAGDLIHVLTYRPGPAPSKGAVLALDGPLGNGECWGRLPEDLCRAGWQVVVPDLAEKDLVPANVMGPEPPPEWRGSAPSSADPVAEALAGAFGDSIEALAVVCVGGRGRVAPLLAHLDRRVTAIVWILPEGPVASAADWELPAGGRLRVLLVASEKRPESLALASDLFSRFNRISELWLLDWGASGCELLASTREQQALQAWLEAAGRAGAAIEVPRSPAPAGGSGKEPGK
jgi:hypothetical protein